jgi:pimeloyl-ACP methyl ester carboxylesterase
MSALLMLCALPAPALAAGHRAAGAAALRPVIFVHGSSGSGGQFETQARRLTSNGFPAGLIETHEYDSTFATTTPDAVYAALDRRIDRLPKRGGADRVDLLAHSLGTLLTQAYLRSSPERAAKVAHYVNLDGRTSSDLPGGVATLAVRGEGDAARAVGGARNVYLPGQAHTETVTSEETFAEFYRFFHDEEPRTTRILPELSITLSGRAQLVPPTCRSRACGWRSTGSTRSPARGSAPGPRRSRSSGPTAPGDPCGRGARPTTSSPWCGTRTTCTTCTSRRSSAPTTWSGCSPAAQGRASPDRSRRATATARSPSPARRSGGAIRARPGTPLSVEGVQALNAANTPRTRRTIGMFVFDAGPDKVTDLSAPLQPFFGTPFLTGMDVHLPATARRDRPLTLVSRPRGEGGRVDVLRVPAWPSSTDRISVQFDDH